MCMLASYLLQIAQSRHTNTNSKKNKCYFSNSKTLGKFLIPRKRQRHRDRERKRQRKAGRERQRQRESERDRHNDTQTETERKA